MVRTDSGSSPDCVELAYQNSRQWISLRQRAGLDGGKWRNEVGLSAAAMKRWPHAAEQVAAVGVMSVAIASNIGKVD